MSFEETVRSVIADQLEVPYEKVAMEASLSDDLQLDELHRMEIVIAFEEEFGVGIPDQDFDAMRTVRDVVEYVVGLMAK